MGLLTRRDALLRAGGLAAAGLIPAANESAGASSPEPAQGRDIDHALQARVDAGQIPGVVAMAANERSVLYEGAFGRRNMASEERMSTDTIFRIASMVKLLTSVAALQLIEQGRLRLDEPAADIDPSLASAEVLSGFGANDVRFPTTSIFSRASACAGGSPT